MRASSQTLRSSEIASGSISQSEGPLSFIRHRRGIIITVVLLACGGAYYYLMNAPPRYTSSASLYVQPVVARVAGMDKSQPTVIPANFLNTQKEIISSVPILALATQRPEIGSLKTFNQAGDPLVWLRQELRVEVGKSDDLIRVQLDSPYPKDAAIIVQAVIDSYIEFQTGQRNSAATKLLDTYQKKKGEAEAHVADLDRTMRQIQKQAGTLSFDQSAREEISRKLMRNREELAEAKRKTARSKALYDKAVLAWGSAPLPTEAAQRREVTDFSAASIVFTSESDLARRPAEIVEAEQKLEKLQEKLLPQHPSVVDAKDRVQALKTRYLIAARHYFQDAEQEELLRQSAQAEDAKLADAFADRASQYARLEADKKDLDQVTSVLGNRIKDIQLEEETGVLNITVLDAAAPGIAAVWPNRARIMLMALAGGLAGGLGLAFLRHRTDPYYRTAEELTAVIDLPVLGCVPAGSRTAGNLNPANPIPLDRWSDNAEICRQIAASLKAVCPKGVAPALLVTSPRSGDGRSTVARDLAIALAGTGEKVLLIDADFQNPSLHALVGTRNTEGLSSVIHGDISAELAAIPTSVAGLEVLTTGPVPALPAAMFDSPEFESFLASAAKEYDRVLIDAPPVEGINDARIAALACGSTLLVLPRRKLHKRVIRETRDRLIGFGANLVGIVLNDVPRQHAKSNRRVAVKRTSVTTLQSLTRMVASDPEKIVPRSRQISTSSPSSAQFQK